MISALGAVGLAGSLALGVNPFGWEKAGSSAMVLARGLLQHGQLPTVAAWFVWSVCLVPIVEETGVRYGLLRFIARRTNSVWAGVVGSALLFGILHLGNAAMLDSEHLVRALSMFAVGLVLGTATVLSDGNISAAIALHATYNAVSLASLFSAAAR
jgi:membrane protease YdiL (CAAX protease family)